MGDPRKHVSEKGQGRGLSQRPRPAVEFRPDDGHRAQALHGKHVKHDERGCGCGREHWSSRAGMCFLSQPRLEFADLGGRAVRRRVECLDGAHEDLSRGERTQHRDAQPAVVAQGGDDGFDGVTHSTENACFEA